MSDIDLMGLAYVADRLAGGGVKRETTETEADRSSPWATLGHFRPCRPVENRVMESR